MSTAGRPGMHHDYSNPHLHVFFNWVQENLVPARQDLALGLRPFLPNDSLRAYFQSHNGFHLRKLLDVEFGEDSDLVPADEILSSGSETIFTILLHMGRARFIREFLRVGLRDSKLPFDPKYPPAHFPHDTANPHFYLDFCDAQWKFCATHIEYWTNRELHKEEILPFTRKERIAKGATSTIYKVSLHPYYNGLQGAPSELIVKTFDDRNATINATNYETERNMYRKIQRDYRNVPNITKFFAAFQQGDTYNLLLEYADKSSLQKFREQLSPPSTQAQIDKFWASHFGLLRALKDLQHHDEDVWHQDIKPPNVLVFSSSEEGSDEYNFTLKLADFGNSHSERRHSNIHRESLNSQDSRGTKTYGSPECYRPDGSLGEGRLKVPVKVDIWSVGCIFSETAVLIYYGKDALESYAEARQQELRQTPGFQNSDCFHNGQHLLKKVEEFHKSIREACEMHRDETTLGVLDLIDHMLAPLETRWDSQELCKAAHLLLPAVPYSPNEFGPLEPTNLNAPVSLERQPVGESSTSVIHEDVTTQPSTLSRPSLRVMDVKNTGNHTRSASSPDGRKRGGQADTREGNVQPSERVSAPPLGTSAADLGYSGLGISAIQRNPDHNLVANHFDRMSISSPFHQRGLSTSDSHQSGMHQLTAQDPNHAPTVRTPKRPVDIPAENPSALNPPLSPQELAEANARMLMIDEAEKWMAIKKNLLYKTTGIPVHLQGEYRLDALKKRDSVIIIDDSLTMSKHKLYLLRLLKVFAYMIKRSDENGLDLLFARDLTSYNLKHSSNVVERVKKQPFAEQCDIRRVLRQVLKPWCDELRRRKRTATSGQVKPLNVYIFTDANWISDCELKPLIKDVVDTLIEVERGDEDLIGIQFISFGYNPGQLEKLEILDDHLGLPIDIVDTKPSDGCLYEMILGAIQKSIDRVKRSARSPPQPHHALASGIRS